MKHEEKHPWDENHLLIEKNPRTKAHLENIRYLALDRISKDKKGVLWNRLFCGLSLEETITLLERVRDIKKFKSKVFRHA